MSPLLIIIFTLFPISSLSQTIQQYDDCTTKLYSCGETIRWIRYPFWGHDRPSYCGLPEFHLTCRDDDGLTTIRIIGITFRVLSINQNFSMITIARDNLQEEPDPCLLESVDSMIVNRFDDTVFSYAPSRILFLGIYIECVVDMRSAPIPDRNKLDCLGDGTKIISFFREELVYFSQDSCKRNITAPVLKKAFQEFKQNETMSLGEVLKQGFPIAYKVDDGGICSRCESSGGTCWSNFTSSVPSCLCPDGMPRLVCRGSSGANWKVKVVIGVAVALPSLLLIFMIYCIMKSSSSNCIATFKHKTMDDKRVEAFIMQYGSVGMKRYSYVDLKKITNSFQVKLGQGSFGIVFKGKLSDGRLVAVKILHSFKGSGQEFINEVASISRTSHVNIVALLGFCFEYQKRALVYEFMPNGSLDKFLIHHVPLEISEHIGIKRLYEVALGIARGLDYLHRGCNTRILHLDIKPHNILLDEDFCPKIADFGLAKLYSRKESMVSLLEARGTIGYIAPEVFNRNFGRISHKSDVYSYGTLILEMVERGINIEVVGSGLTNELNFPYWIYTRLKKDEILLDGVTTIEENGYVRKMTIVGLWCIQADPGQRPSINEVIEMLEGSIEELEVPPKPFFSSPLQSPNHHVLTHHEE
ncbi:hypothetical protein L6452_15375 [Arctium lappa]|uniref:Uncharacterized protein n=1 Tax=Arctium lappa TaxID=4217 RepID=A0ACB9CNF4_ARCLA|nr:hypothetical protein L6452_15375 [Arctium lappa]